MKRFYIYLFLFSAMCLLVYSSCKKAGDKAASADGGYPPGIAKIMINKCAVTGCHNAASYSNAGNLLLDTWEHLFQGSNNGAVVVPYSALFSPLLYFVNTDYAIGPVATPTMPYSTPGNPVSPLSDDEYDALQVWIAKGAPDKNGNVAFSGDPGTRQKIYVSQQGCDLVAVIDAQSKLVMRYTKVGLNPAITEGPGTIKTTTDGFSLFFDFVNGNYLQKIDTRTDTVVNSINLGSQLPPGGTGGWNSLCVSDTLVVVAQGGAAGFLTAVNTATSDPRKITEGLLSPFGIAANTTFDTFLVTAQTGNCIYKVSTYTMSSPELISVDGNPISTAHTGTSPDPYDIVASPDHSKYFVSCANSNEVRIMDGSTDTLINAIPVGATPMEMTCSPSRSLLFVSCREDASNPFPGCRGSVYVIDYNSATVIKVIYGDFYQPYGIAVDEKFGNFYVISTNANPTGIPAHHTNPCGGNAGWYSVYDLNTLLPSDNKRYELTKLPWSAATRFR